MSKLTKLLTQPKRFFIDAQKNKLIENLHDKRTHLSLVNQAFVDGDINNANQLLAELPELLAEKHLLAARLHLFAGNNAQASHSAVRTMQLCHVQSSEFKQAFYLQQEALRQTGNSAQAKAMLEHIPFQDNSARYYRALRLVAKLQDNLALFERELVQLEPSQPQWLRAHNHYLLLLRDTNQHQVALQQAQQLLQLVQAQPPRKNNKKPPERTADAKQRWQIRAGLALQQLQQDLAAYDIEFFLVSGTLLGCVREGQILGHDTDIDVGVMPDVSTEQLRQALTASSRFRLLEIDSQHTLYLVHTSGVKVDVFRHYQEDGRLYHEGIKCRWWNSLFELIPADFLGGQYLIPVDSNTYLTENYGDWRTPVIDFATFLDTPNMQTTHVANMVLYLISQAIAAYRQDQQPKFLRYHQAANDLLSKDTTRNG